MKLKTNLRPEELELVGLGIQALAKSQREAQQIVTENNAEKELLRRIDNSLDAMLESLQADIVDML